MPQDNHTLEDIPQVNHPPRIVEEGVSPQTRIITTDTACAQLQFSAPVEDPDLGDLLFFGWYFSDLGGNTAPLQPSKAGTIENSSGQTVRKDEVTLKLDFGPTSPLNQPGVHVIELLVSDGAVVNRIPQPRTLLSDGGIGALTYVSSYAWVVNVTDTGVCP